MSRKTGGLLNNRSLSGLRSLLELEVSNILLWAVVFLFLCMAIPILIFKVKFFSILMFLLLSISCFFNGFYIFNMFFKEQKNAGRAIPVYIILGFLILLIFQPVFYILKIRFLLVLRVMVKQVLMVASIILEKYSVLMQ